MVGLSGLWYWPGCPLLCGSQRWALSLSGNKASIQRSRTSLQRVLVLLGTGLLAGCWKPETLDKESAARRLCFGLPNGHNKLLLYLEKWNGPTDVDSWLCERKRERYREREREKTRKRERERERKKKKRERERKRERYRERERKKRKNRSRERWRETDKENIRGEKQKD